MGGLYQKLLVVLFCRYTERFQLFFRRKLAGFRL